MRERTDDADGARRTVVGVVACRPAAGRAADGPQRADASDAVENLVHGDKRVALHAGVLANRHDFDEANRDRPFARELGEGFEFVVVGAAHDHAVDFDRIEPGFHRSIEAAQYLTKSRSPRDRFESPRVQRVKRKIDPPQTRTGQLAGLLREQEAVGREREVVHAGNRRKQTHERCEVAAQQRLAAGQPDASHADRGRRAHDRRDLLVRQDVVATQPRKAAFRHAVDAA